MPHNTCTFTYWKPQPIIISVSAKLNGHIFHIYQGSTVGNHYNAVQNNVILYTLLQWQRRYINQSLYSQKTPHISPSRVSYGVSIMRILKKIDRIIMASHCIMWLWWDLEEFELGRPVESYYTAVQYSMQKFTARAKTKHKVWTHRRYLVLCPHVRPVIICCLTLSDRYPGLEKASRFWILQVTINLQTI